MLPGVGSSGQQQQAVRKEREIAKDEYVPGPSHQATSEHKWKCNQPALSMGHTMQFLGQSLPIHSAPIT